MKYQYTGLEVAIIGMSGRFPGANNINEFWENLKKGKETISFFNNEELLKEGENINVINNPNYVKAKGIINNSEYFDPYVFDYIPTEVELMDPQIRVLHECIWEAFEDAGYAPNLCKDRVGLYVGASDNILWQGKALTHKDSNLDNLSRIQLGNKDHLGTLLSYKFGFKGPSYSLISACSTSLSSVHLACRALLGGECRIAVAGGIKLSIPVKSGYLYEEGMILSPDGHCRAFDKNSNGTVFSDGAGIVVLKSLEDAINDGDNIYSVIKGTAVNNDGKRKVGYSAPSVGGQEEVIRMALNISEVQPESIGYIEGHGTGTPMGDIIELKAIENVFGDIDGYRSLLGSVKSNIGHTDVASGVIGIIKTALCLKNRKIPPSVNFESFNQEINKKRFPFEVNTKLEDWTSSNYPLRAGVNSFGQGGTNAHIILEEFPEKGCSENSDTFHILNLSASTRDSLERNTETLVGFLSENKNIRLEDVAYTLNIGRARLKHRKMIVASSVEETISLFSDKASRKVKEYSLVKSDEYNIVFMFGGLGAQYINMGVDLYNTYDIYKEEVDKCLNILNDLLDFNIKQYLFPENLNVSDVGTHQDSIANNAEISHPLLFVTEWAIAKLLMFWGIIPKAMIGYSFGEYVAACLSGVFSLSDALKVVVERSKLIKNNSSKIMLSVPLSVTEVKSYINESISIAIDNGVSCVLAVPCDEINDFENTLKNNRIIPFRMENVQGVHSLELKSACDELRNIIDEVQFGEIKIPFISNVTGDWFSQEDINNRDYWGRHLTQTVQFSEGISKIKSLGKLIFVECGPGRDMCNIVNMNIKDKENVKITDFLRVENKEISDVYYAYSKLGQIWMYGKDINWDNLYVNRDNRRVSLPTYSFDRQYFWSNSDIAETLKEINISGAGEKQSIDKWFYLPSWKAKYNPLKAKEEDLWLDENIFVFAKESEFFNLLKNSLNSKNNNLIYVFEAKEYKKEKNIFYINPKRKEDYARLFDDSGTLSGNISIVHLWATKEGERNSYEISEIEEYQDKGFNCLMYLAQTIGNLYSTNSIKINVVTNNVSKVFDDDIKYPELSTILSPIKIIPKEYQNIQCKLIDVDFIDTNIKVIFDRVKHEILREGIEEEVIAFRGDNRYIQSFEQLEIVKSEENFRLNKNGVYLLTGGLGDLGLLVAKFLSKKYQAKIILTSRSDFPDRMNWDNIINDELQDKSLKHTINEILEIEKEGGEVLICKADVGVYDEMFELKNTIINKFGKVNGIFHLALHVDGGLIYNCTEAMVRNVFQGKVYGTINIDKVFGDDIEFLTLFSSASSILMGVGHLVYSASNAFMDSFSHFAKRYRKYNTISINWDAWQEVGSALAVAKRNTKDLSENEETTIFNGIKNDEGIEVLSNLMAYDMSQIVVSPTDLNFRLNPPKISNKNNSEKDLVQNLKRYKRPDLDNEYILPKTKTEKIIVDIWCNLFGYNEIGIQDDFFELGGNSVKAIVLASIIHKELDIKLGVSEIFKNPNIKLLSGFIESQGKEEKFINILPAEKKEYYNASTSQKGLCFLQKINENSTSYNENQALILEGKLDLDMLEKAFHKLIERHESLRTSFISLDHNIVQRVNYNFNFKIEYIELPKGEDEKAVIKRFIRPFKLESKHLFRVCVVKLEKFKHLLVIDMHHIITDLMSFQLLVSDLVYTYQEEVLPNMKIQYKDYVIWQESDEYLKLIKKQEEYWINRYKDGIPTLKLPTDYIKEDTFDRECGELLEFYIGKDLLEQLENLSKKTNSTIYNLLMSAYFILLHKYSGEEDIVVGMPVNGRLHADMEDIIGMFINTIPLRNYPLKDSSFEEFLEDVKQNTFEAIDNQLYQYDKLINKLQPEREGGKTLLIETVFTFLESARSVKQNNKSIDFKVTSYDSRNTISKFNLILAGNYHNDGIKMWFNYSNDLFKKETIQDMIDRFLQILEMIISDRSVKLRDIEFDYGFVEATTYQEDIEETDFSF